MNSVNEKKKRKNRRGHGVRAYLGDFHQTVSGEYVYTGATYSHAPRERSRRKVMCLLWLYSSVMAVAALIPGCIAAGGMINCPYVLIPFGGELISAGSVIWALVSLSTNKDPLREYVYTSTVEAIPWRSLLTAACAGLAFCGEIVYVLFHREEATPGAWLMILPMAAAAAAALGNFYVIRAETWERTEPQC